MTGLARASCAREFCSANVSISASNVLGDPRVPNKLVNEVPSDSYSSADSDIRTPESPKRPSALRPSTTASEFPGC